MSGDQISIEVDGERHVGRMVVESGFVTVTAIYGSKSMQIGSSPPERLARMMLREMVEDDRRSKRWSKF